MINRAINKRLTTLVKDITVAHCYVKYANKIKVEYRSIQKYVLKAINNYAKLRISLLQNPQIKSIEADILNAGIRLGINYFKKNYALSDTIIDEQKIADEIAPELNDILNTTRVTLFMALLKYTDLKLDNENK